MMQQIYRWKKGLIFSFLFLSSSTVHSAKVLLGDDTTAGAPSFSFNMGPTAYDASRGFYYLGAAGVPGAGAEKWAISIVAGATGTIAANTSERATVNGADDAHPFYNRQVYSMGMSGTDLLAIEDTTRSILYQYTSYPGTTPSTLLRSDTMLDANAAASPLIRSITGTGSVAFAAIDETGGGFGVDGSGIAVFTKDAAALTQQEADPNNAGVRAVNINPATVGANPEDSKIFFGAIGANPTAVDLHWDAQLARLFIAVNPTAAAGAANGAKGIVMGYLTTVNGQKELNLVDIATDDAFEDNTRIVGGRSNTVLPEMSFVRTMHTSTGLSYLVVVGDTSGATPEQKVAALPLVDKRTGSTASWIEDAGHGVLAAVTTAPTTNYEAGYFYSRTFDTPATAAGHLYAEGAGAATVGQGALGATITDIQVVRDTVFVSALEVGDFYSGVYYSQALFNANGSVKGWTPWERALIPVSGANDVNLFAHMPTTGQLITLEGLSGTGDYDTVRQTQWSAGALDELLGGDANSSSIGLVEQLASEFPEDQGGIENIFDFPKATLGFEGGNDQVSLMVATGNKKVVIVRSGVGNGADTKFLHEEGDFLTGKITATDGTTGTPVAGTKMISVTGGVLDDLGPITSAAIVTGGVDLNYLVVGGVNGVAVLRRGGGVLGWGDGAGAGLDWDFSTFPAGMTFHEIGDYSNVRKLWTTANGDILFILTDTELLRIAANTLNGVAAGLTGTSIATVADLGLPAHASFSDFISSERLGLLATSEGLYRAGNGADIETAGNSAAVSWTQVALPGGYTPVTRLIPVSETALKEGFSATTGGGMVYVVNGDVSTGLTALYRLSISGTSGGDAITANTVQLIQDIVKEGSTGPFAYLGDYRNYFHSDGASLFTSRSKHSTDDPKLQSFPLNFSDARYKIFSQKNITTIDLGIAGASTIGPMIRNSAQGGWIESGSFGIRVHE